MTNLSKLAQEKLAQTRQTKLVKNLEKKLPFEINEETLKEIANNILIRAKEISESLKNDPMGTVKNYKALLDVHSLAAKKKPAKKATKTAPKKALKKAKTKATKSKKAVH